MTGTIYSYDIKLICNKNNDREKVFGSERWIEPVPTTNQDKYWSTEPWVLHATDKS